MCCDFVTFCVFYYALTFSVVLLLSYLIYYISGHNSTIASNNLKLSTLARIFKTLSSLSYTMKHKTNFTLFLNVTSRKIVPMSFYIYECKEKKQLEKLINVCICKQEYHLPALLYWRLWYNIYSRVFRIDVAVWLVSQREDRSHSLHFTLNLWSLKCFQLILFLIAARKINYSISNSTGYICFKLIHSSLFVTVRF